MAAGQQHAQGRLKRPLMLMMRFYQWVHRVPVPTSDGPRPRVALHPPCPKPILGWGKFADLRFVSQPSGAEAKTQSCMVGGTVH